MMSPTGTSFLGISTQFGIPMPQIPGSVGDVIAKFYDDSGNALADGTEWTIGDVNGTELSFLITGIPVTINVKFKGKVESKTETFTVKNKVIKTWKESVTATVNILGTNNTIKLNFWYSDDPDGQIRFMQESACNAVALESKFEAQVQVVADGTSSTTGDPVLLAIECEGGQSIRM